MSDDSVAGQEITLGDQMGYADPVAAAATNAKVKDVIDRLASLDLTAQQVTELAAMFATSYVVSDNAPDSAREYYAAELREDPEGVWDEAVEALAWAYLFGPNGSDGQRAASQTLAWEQG